VMVDKAWSELVDVEETLFEEDLDALGVMLWIVMWTLGIVDEALEVRWLGSLGFLVGPQSKLRQ